MSKRCMVHSLTFAPSYMCKRDLAHHVRAWRNRWRTRWMAPPYTTEKGWQKCWYSWREWLTVWSAKNKAWLNEGNQCKPKSNITQSPHHNATKTDDRNRGREAQQCNKNNKTQRINNNWREGQWVKANRTAGKTGDTRLLNQNMKQSRTNADRKHSSIPTKSQ